MGQLKEREFWSVGPSDHIVKCDDLCARDGQGSFSGDGVFNINSRFIHCITCNNPDAQAAIGATKEKSIPVICFEKMHDFVYPDSKVVIPVPEDEPFDNGLINPSVKT